MASAVPPGGRVLANEDRDVTMTDATVDEVRSEVKTVRVIKLKFASQDIRDFGQSSFRGCSSLGSRRTCGHSRRRRDIGHYEED